MASTEQAMAQSSGAAAGPAWLDPAIAELLRDDHGLRDLPGVDLPSFRALNAPLLDPPCEGVTRSSATAGARCVEVRIHAKEKRSDRSPRACVVWIHSGGHILDNWLGNGALLDRWALELDAVVVVPRYALSPERPYPEAIDDCSEVLSWVVGNATELCIDPGRVALAGVSAGGGLAAALALRLREDHSGPWLTCLMLQYPMLDDRPTASNQWPDAAVWSREANRFAWDSYLANVADDVPSDAAPARTEDVSGLPPTLLLVGTADLFLDEDLEFARRLAHANVPVDVHCYAGAPHGFMTFGSDTPVGARAVEDATAWLASHLAPRGDQG